MSDQQESMPSSSDAKVQGKRVKISYDVLVLALILVGAGYYVLNYDVLYVDFGTALLLGLAYQIIFACIVCAIIFALIPRRWARIAAWSGIGLAAIIAASLLGWVAYSGYNSTDPSLLTEATGEDEFFALLATDTKIPEFCEKINPAATVSASGGWFDNAKDYAQSECYQMLAASLRDESLCKKVRPLKVRGEGDGNSSEETCRSDVQDGYRLNYPYHPYSIENIETIITKIGYSKSDVEKVFREEIQADPDEYLDSVHSIYSRFYEYTVRGLFARYEAKPIGEAKAARDAFISRALTLPVAHAGSASPLESGVQTRSTTKVDWASVYWSSDTNNPTNSTITVSNLHGETQSETLVLFILEASRVGSEGWDAVSMDPKAHGPVTTYMKFFGDAFGWDSEFIAYERAVSAGTKYSFKAAVYDEKTHELLAVQRFSCEYQGLCNPD